MAPVIMGNPERPELGEELTNSFCRMDPHVAQVFARATFLSDNRADLATVDGPDAGAAVRPGRDRPTRGRRVRARADPGSVLVTLDATGHCPQLSAPRETAEQIIAFGSSG